MTKKERFRNAVACRPVDQLPCAESMWPETTRRWKEEGHIPEEVDYVRQFDWEICRGGWINSTANLDFEPEVLEETEETVLMLDGNGAKLRRHKHHSSTPEHVDFTVKDRAGWEEHIKPFLLEVDRRRIPFENYRRALRIGAEDERYTAWSGVAPFEQMHPVCGHEHMLMGMALDPEWVQDMVNTYVNMTLMHLEVLFAEEGTPDGMFVYEDLGFKEKPFMSPQMYRDILQPGHARLFDFAHSKGCQVIVHSCGFVEPLVPGLVEAGMDCLQALEVKAGMDMRRLADAYPGKLAFMGNIDVREIISNDRARIDKEMTEKIPYVLDKGCGYILHSDHSIPPEVEYETLEYFFRKGRSIREPAKMFVY